MRLIVSYVKRTICVLAVVGLQPISVSAQSASALFEKAQASEKRLHQSAKTLKNKKAWVDVAKNYHRVVLKHPRSGFCDDALYFEGQIYEEVDRRFKDTVALKRALDAFHLLATGYPASRWAKKARLARAKLYLDRLNDKKRAEKEYKTIADAAPSSAEGLEAKRMLVKLRPPPAPPRRVEDVTGRQTPSLRPAVVALRNIRHWSGRDYTRIVIDMDREVKFSRGRLKGPERIFFDLFNTRLSKNLASRTFPVGDGFLKQIRVGQNQSDVVRVVLDFDSISDYKVFFLPDPYRMVVDILGTKPSPGPPVLVAGTPATSPDETAVSAHSSAASSPKDAEPHPTISDTAPETRVKDPSAAPGVRADASTARATGENPASPKTTRPTPTPNTPTRPTRSADANNSATSKTPKAAETASAPAPASGELSTDLRLPAEPTRDGYSLARQLGLQAKRIVIDPGHGGKDPGTARNRVREKVVALDISQRVAKLLREDGEFDVVMTRNSDVFIPLEERTAIANAQEADLFVSIHVNAARSSRARGIETFYLNLATTPDAEELAARENAVTTRRIAELESILDRVMNNVRIQESRELANVIQDSMGKRLLNSKRDRRNRGVKTAPLYVLLGARMPAALVEVGFVSNPADRKLLESSKERQKLARSIAEGIRTYHAKLSKTTKVSTSEGDIVDETPPK